MGVEISSAGSACAPAALYVCLEEPSQRRQLARDGRGGLAALGQRGREAAHGASVDRSRLEAPFGGPPRELGYVGAVGPAGVVSDGLPAQLGMEVVDQPVPGGRELR